MTESSKVRFLFFGAIADLMSIREETVEVTDGTSIAKAFEGEVSKRGVSIGINLRFARNQEFASGKEIIHDGDEIAVFTAVSGG